MLAGSLAASTHYNDVYAGVKRAGLHQHATGNLYTVKQLRHSWSQPESSKKKPESSKK